MRFWWDRLGVPGGRFSQQMGIPTEMHLEEARDRRYLCALPIKEVETLRYGGETLEDMPLQGMRKLETGNIPVDLQLEMPMTEGAVLEFDLFGSRLQCHIDRNTLTFNGVQMPLSAEGKRLNLRLIVDKCSLEIFADNGKFCLTQPMICDDNLPRILISANKDVQLSRLQWYGLKSIHA